MISELLLLLTVLFLAIEIQKYFKIPSPVSLLLLSYLSFYIFPHLRIFSQENFAELVLFLIPILITADALQMDLEDLKKNALSLIFLAVVAVILSLFFGYWTAEIFFSEYGLGAGALIALFAMVLATDPVSVVSVFSSFKVPHRLKILAEGESLFNDATALIIFSFIALPMMEGAQIGPVDIAVVSVKVLLLSVVIGLVIGFLGIQLMRTTENGMSELMVILLTAYSSFEMAEHFHVSGLLAVIVAIITLNTITQKSLREIDRRVRKGKRILDRTNRSKKIFSHRFMSRITRRLGSDITEIEQHKLNMQYVSVLALLANAFLFISMASIVHVDLLIKYSREIFWMFVVTTLIRAFMMALFALLSNKREEMTDISFRWWSVLLFAGIKGGLSIVMLQMLPENFAHREMFEAIVVGVILLSTLLYALALVVIISMNKISFEKEYSLEHHH